MAPDTKVSVLTLHHVSIAKICLLNFVTSQCPLISSIKYYDTYVVGDWAFPIKEETIIPSMMCVCLYIYIYMCVCVCVCILIAD